MAEVTIYVSLADIEAAKRIAKKMFPGKVVEERFVLASALDLGMSQMKVAWKEEEVPEKESA